MEPEIVSSGVGHKLEKYLFFYSKSICPFPLDDLGERRTNNSNKMNEKSR